MMSSLISLSTDSSETSDSSDSEPEALAKQRKSSDEAYEPHCWVCHNPFTKVKCSQCLKTYHNKCVEVKYGKVDFKAKYRKIPFETTSTTECEDVRLKRTVTFEVGVCPECVICSSGLLLSEYDAGEVRAILLNMAKKLQKRCPYYRNLNDLQDVVYHMDTNTIRKKVHDCEYNNLEEFLCDVNWIHHNVSVYADAEYRGRTYNEILTGVKALLKCCQEDVNDINVCHECYPSWGNFNCACTKPHVLVWVTSRSYPTWPAKAYQITQRKKEKFVVVKFFDEESKQTVPIKSCSFFNERTSINKKVKKALKKCEECKLDMEQAFGKVYSPPKNIKEKLNSDMSKCIKKMFPEYIAKEDQMEK